jgi:hypothetical protein
MIKLRKVRWAGHIARVGQKRNVYKLFIGKSERKRPRGRPGHRWEDNIRINVREIVWEGVDWIHMARDRDQWRVLVNTVTSLRVP